MRSTERGHRITFVSASATAKPTGTRRTVIEAAVVNGQTKLIDTAEPNINDNDGGNIHGKADSGSTVAMSADATATAAAAS